MVRAFFIVDLLIALAYPLDWAIGGVYWKISALIDPRGQGNLVRWYASTQLFLVAFLCAAFVRSKFDRRVWTSWLLPALPVVFVALSFEQIVEIHEWLRYRIGRVLPTGSFGKDVFYVRDITVVGSLLITLLIIGMSYSAKQNFRRGRLMAKRYIVGFVLFLAGPPGIESLSPLISHNITLRIVQLACEELLELIGITFMLWATRDVLVAHDVSPSLIGSPRGDPPA